METATLDHRRSVLPRPHCVEEMESLPIPDELLPEIFLRLPSPADLARASAACVSFRRVAADRAFLRRYRKLHAPPLLGFLDSKVFHSAAPPHHSAPAASAAALAADFSFSFLRAPAFDWAVQDVCDGRVLLDRPSQRDIDEERRYEVVFPEMVVCDPLHRRYLLLPPIPDDLAASVEHPLWKKRHRYCETFLVPSEDEDDETSFNVIWMVQCATKVVALAFSSSTGQWRAVSSQSWSNLFAGLLSSTGHILFRCRQYAYGCFYWVTDCREYLLVLDTWRMEFSLAYPPTEARGDCNIDIGIVETGEGGLGMFLHARMSSDLTYYTLRQGIGGSSSKWHKEKTVSLGSKYMFIGSTGSYLVLHQGGSYALERGCLTLDVKMFQLERVCALKYFMSTALAYCNFPPSLLSTPRVSSGYCYFLCASGRANEAQEHICDLFARMF
ncbi:uncharacterized protein LOC100835416 isoform X2 [Brachypodium distachyon]|uniref:F-box domain-containing protein n=1 Tax=Brachypodium distachyon TaxID=15368 RepID=A0A0Q3F334_BRADI|nr:uncharacterized protein LOC100835416 isoform X2 [Brachypodium distachyon]KQJ92892.2 hypothetical protein BRADI_3g01406v3 [Brachypodium distachyon]|eukprot:XP_024317371.1 uncharacterized protein LOC100835416 isoform X2 [Brachypodium distachyon]